MVDLPTLFSDVKPIPQEDGPDPVCSIAYPARFVEAFDYFRAVSRIDERSERAFQLTTVCLELNPANYTVWHYRRQCLAALSSPPSDALAGGGNEKDSKVVFIDGDRIESDLVFAEGLGGSNPKNYQIWYHRRALLDSRFASAAAAAAKKVGLQSDGDLESNMFEIATKELEYVDRILDDDSKNYHSWSHRQWLVRTVNSARIWESEKEYCHTRILSDVRNNSAWNQRWFATHKGLPAPLCTVETVKGEADYALGGAAVDCFNESPWRYLIGVLMEHSRSAAKGGDAAGAASLIDEFVSKVRAMKQMFGEQPDHPPGSCICLMSALVDLLEAKGDEASLTEASNLIDELKNEDRVRKKYWDMRKQSVLVS